MNGRPGTKVIELMLQNDIHLFYYQCKDSAVSSQLSASLPLKEEKVISEISKN